MWCTTAGVLSDRRLSPSSASSYGDRSGSDSDDDDNDEDMDGDENEQKITVPYLITAMIRKGEEWRGVRKLCNFQFRPRF